LKQISRHFTFHLSWKGRRSSSVSVLPMLRTGRPGLGPFSPRYHFQAGSGAHPASQQIGTGTSLPGCKAARAWSWQLTSI